MREPAQRLDVAARFVTALCTSAEPASQAAASHSCADGDLVRSVLWEGMRHLWVGEVESKSLSDELLASSTWIGLSAQNLFHSEVVKRQSC